MARRIRLFLVRHAVSAANLDKRENARLPDSKVPLAKVGHIQARGAGEFLAEYLKDHGGRMRILCSPYMRTRETSAGIEAAFSANDISFDKREEIALREISFGLFDGLEDDELPVHFPVEYAHYKKHVDFEGEFYAPMPMGESRVQVADRVKTVFGTILRDASPDRSDRIENFIIVSHGVTIRAFIMQWLHRSPEWYEEQTNPQNASISLIEGDGQRYHHNVIFDGFKRGSTKQEVREQGKIRD